MAQVLKFYARGDALVNARPGETFPPGTYPQYINRAYDTETRGWPAQPDPFVCSADSECGRNAVHAMTDRYGRRNPPLWPADEATALAVGHPKSPALELVSGEWVEKRTTEQPAKSSKG